MGEAEMKRRVGIVLFDGFEVLDVFGPVELFSQLPDRYRLAWVAPEAGPVRSAQGVEVMAGEPLDEAAPAEIVLVPGGMGTRRLVEDRGFLDRLGSWSSAASMVTSVCTGSAVLAAAGLLEGYRATSNKRSFAWASGHGRDVTWLPKARWVHDRDRWTSSGVAAGMDMAAAIIRELDGEVTAGDVVQRIELEVHADSTWDPFAAANGLV